MWLFKFCRGKTDYNHDGIPDNQQVLDALEVLAAKLDLIEKKQPPPDQSSHDPRPEQSHRDRT
jgi:hypothetical protein